MTLRGWPPGQTAPRWNVLSVFAVTAGTCSSQLRGKGFEAGGIRVDVSHVISG
jgi:hypothetical protein